MDFYLNSYDAGWESDDSWEWDHDLRMSDVTVSFGLPGLSSFPTTDCIMNFCIALQNELLTDNVDMCRTDATEGGSPLRSTACVQPLPPLDDRTLDTGLNQIKLKHTRYYTLLEGREARQIGVQPLGQATVPELNVQSIRETFRPHDRGPHG